jgi:histidinol phosphatase-like PHP family hydrolase
MSKRYDFHIHSLLTEGELVPSEIARRCSVLGYWGIAITDHVDTSNLEHVLGCLVPVCDELEENFGLRVLPGVELTHIHPPLIEKLAKRSKALGAKIVIVHGETIVEPVQKGTNRSALSVPEVDILAHPGLITDGEALMAKKNGVFLELSSRKGHCLTNGHVAKTAARVDASLLLNSDAHIPSDFISFEDAKKIVLGCGLSDEEAERVLVDNPKSLLGSLI